MLFISINEDILNSLLVFVYSVLSFPVQQSCKVHHWRLSSGSVNHVQHQTWLGRQEGGTEWRERGWDGGSNIRHWGHRKVDRQLR